MRTCLGNGGQYRRSLIRHLHANEIKRFISATTHLPGPLELGLGVPGALAHEGQLVAGGQLDLLRLVVVGPAVVAGVRRRAEDAHRRRHWKKT